MLSVYDTPSSKIVILVYLPGDTWMNPGYFSAGIAQKYGKEGVVSVGFIRPGLSAMAVSIRRAGPGKT
tara:strand:+ start:355 stop:558 length:204 start_codon:yes stop_codon:yes gene_type:complete